MSSHTNTPITDAATIVCVCGRMVPAKKMQTIERELAEANARISNAVRLLRDASELWATSRAREERGPWDADWDKRRTEFLATLPEAP